MSIEVKVPAVGESITSGVLSAWHKKNGESIQAGEILFSLDTDKISTDVNAPESGKVSTLVKEGDEVQIGQVVATIEASNSSPQKPASPPPTVAAAPPAPEKEEKVAKKEPVQEASAKAAAASAAAADTPSSQGEKSDLPTPAAVKASSATTITSETKAQPPPTAQAAPTTPAKSVAPIIPAKAVAPTTTGGERITRKRLSPLRRKIAAQLVSAQQTAAILTTFNECDMAEVMKLRKALQEEFQKKHGVKLGFMSFFIKAAVEALRAVPSINSRIEGDELIQNHFYNIGVAVGTERGLMVPVIRDCDQKSFADLERELAGFAVKAREGKVTLEDLQDGIFTISNGGVYGSLLSTPILNPPQSGILGMHKIQERPVAVQGQVVIRPMMYLALSYDHRVIDGKEAVTALIRIKDCIENPVRLLLET